MVRIGHHDVSSCSLVQTIQSKDTRYIEYLIRIRDCVCVREREREREIGHKLHNILFLVIQSYYMDGISYFIIL